MNFRKWWNEYIKNFDISEYSDAEIFKGLIFKEIAEDAWNASIEYNKSVDKEGE